MTDPHQISALYLSRYAAGHAPGCPLSIPEIRSSTTRAQCECVDLQQQDHEQVAAICNTFAP